ncbi:MAG: ABC transporter substrate-binding protein [Pseudomonadota bacterium]|nr:ABC transporter substrate-binding protein [Pseudomonadota bacterium]
MLGTLHRRTLLTSVAAACVLVLGGAAHAADPVKIGLVTALSGQSAKAGEAISRGLLLAIDDINAKGGVLGGRKLELLKRDDEANPAKGQIAARELIFKDKVAVLFGGLDTPVSLAMIQIANDQKVPFMDPWAAGTKITHNGFKPNFVFRVSAVDELVDKAMLQYAQKHFSTKKPGIIVVNNPWGESNQVGLIDALNAQKMKPAAVEKFETNDVDVTPQLSRLKEAGADAILMVGNVGPSAQVVKSMDRMGWKVPIVSHWGPAGGRFSELAGPNAKNVIFVQTYSFFGKQTPVGERVLAELKKKYSDIKGPDDVTPAVGYANAYDAMQLTALAIDKAGSTDGDAIRQGFYKIDQYDGLIKTYKKPFTPENHDAIDKDDYVWTQFIDGKIVPVGTAVK